MTAGLRLGFALALGAFALGQAVGQGAKTDDPDQAATLLKWAATVTYASRLTWDPTENPCSWPGVSCDDANGLVTAIEIPHKIYTRKPDDYLRDEHNPFPVLPGERNMTLPALQKLGLTDMALHGPLPPGYSTLRNLTGLELCLNQLTGTLPNSWSSLTNMESTYLCNNHFSGSLPKNWSAMQNLRGLFLMNNTLSGQLPAEWSSMTSVTTMSLNSNQLSGSLPPEWRALSNLEDLSISDNNFTGTIPREWSKMQTLSHFILARNPYLTGCLPPAWKGRVQFLDETKRAGPEAWDSEPAAGALLGTNVSGWCTDT